LLNNSEPQPRRNNRKSLGIGGSPLPPSPLGAGISGPTHAGEKHAQYSSGSSSQLQLRPRERSNSASSGSSSETLMFSLSDNSNEHLNMNAAESPVNTPPGSPKANGYARRRQHSYHAPGSPHMPIDLPAPASPRGDSSHSSSTSVPIPNISDKFRRMRLATESSVPNSPPASPIIGSNPKRSWFSNFFTGSPQTSPRGETSYPMQTLKDGIELAAEVQRTLSALKTTWRLTNEDLYEAEYKAADGTALKFSMEVMNGKNKQDVDIRFVVVTLREGPIHYFNFLCAQVHNEINL